MATANSSCSDFRVIDLVRSEFPEDFGNALRALEVVQGFCQNLAPILKYATPEVLVIPAGTSRGSCYEASTLRGITKTVRAARLLNVYAGGEEGEKLFLTRDKKFFVARECRHHNPEGVHYHEVRANVVMDTAEGVQFLNTWELAPFGELVEALNQLTADTVEKQRRHLLTTERRDAMMAELMSVIRRHREAPADPQ